MNEPVIDGNENKPSRQEIFRAELVDKKELHITVSTPHVPSILYCLELIRLEVDRMIIDEKIWSAQENSKITIPSKHNILDFVRRK